MIEFAPSIFVDGEPSIANPDPTLQMGYDLVVWLLRDNLPEVFIKSGHVKCRVIIGLCKCFYRVTLTSQAATWSDYKTPEYHELFGRNKN